MMSTDAVPAIAASPADEGRISVLEATLWKRLTDASDIAALAAPWIALQCGLIAGAARGLVAIVDKNETAHPAACWPEGLAPAELLPWRMRRSARRGVVQPGQA